MKQQPYTPEEVADLFGITKGTLANWRSAGRGPAYNKPRRHRNAPVVYPRRDTLRWGQANGYLKKGTR